MNIQDLLHAGNLSEVEAELTQKVKKSPTDMQLRTFLFEVLSFQGDFQRADRQLDVVSQYNAENQLATQVYKDILQAELQRQEVFGKGVKPHFMFDEPEYVALHVEAIQALHVGLKFPLIPVGMSTEPFDLLFWMDLAKTLFPPNTIPTHVFWKRHFTPEQSYMLVFSKKPGPQAFLNLIRPETEDSSWCDFSPQILGEGIQGKEEERSEGSITMNEPSLSLQEWLNQCCVGK